MVNPVGRRPAGFMVVMSPWWSVCRDLGDGGPGGGFVHDGFVGRVCGDQGLDGEVVHGSWQAPADLVDQGGGVVAEEGVGAAGEFEVMNEVGLGLLCLHSGHGVAQCDALVEGCECPELDAPPQGGLPDEQAGERAVAVHVGIGQLGRVRPN
jgi:hypothetical protein